MSGSVQQIQYVVNQHIIPPLWFVDKKKPIFKRFDE
jgi:hypothetical protein